MTSPAAEGAGSAGARRVHVHEVAPRDGLQNEAASLSLEQKIGLVERLAAACPASVEITSFVRPDWIPQLADADELAAALRDAPFRDGVRFGALVPNRRGYERFRRASLDEVTLLVSASETHNRANLNRSIEDSLAELEEVHAAAKQDGFRTRAYVSMAFGCPFEGRVDPARVADIAGRFQSWGADVVALADTLGVAHPQEVRALCTAVRASEVDPRLGLHLHDTYGRALANVRAGWEAGAVHVDAAAGGCGGCPYAPGAAGNLPTGRLLRLLDELGVEHGMDAAALAEGVRFLEEALGRILPDRQPSAGPGS